MSDDWMIPLVLLALVGPTLVLLGFKMRDDLNYPTFWRDTFTPKRLIATAIVTIVFIAIWLIIPADFRSPQGSRSMKNPLATALVFWFAGWGCLIYSRDTDTRGRGIIFIGIAVLGIIFSVTLVLFWKFG